jgi:hypothetical protein
VIPPSTFDCAQCGIKAGEQHKSTCVYEIHAVEMERRRAELLELEQRKVAALERIANLLQADAEREERLDENYVHDPIGPADFGPATPEPRIPGSVGGPAVPGRGGIEDRPLVMKMGPCGKCGAISKATFCYCAENR